jgi:hypothetical protein
VLTKLPTAITTRRIPQTTTWQNFENMTNFSSGQKVPYQHVVRTVLTYHSVTTLIFQIPPSSQIIGCFKFSRFTYIIMHLYILPLSQKKKRCLKSVFVRQTRFSNASPFETEGVVYIQMHKNIYESNKAKTTYNLKRRE